jgi:hypothetical protein
MDPNLIAKLNILTDGHQLIPFQGDFSSAPTPADKIDAATARPLLLNGPGSTAHLVMNNLNPSDAADTPPKKD